MRFHDNHGRGHELGKQIGAGGEGTVFEVAANGQVVAKIYKSPPSAEKAAKLLWMARHASDGITKFAAWPLATLHQTLGGPVSGVLLPRVNAAREIHELYSPVHRKVHFPSADWAFLIRVARNCAAAMATLHEHHVIIGDVNQGNFFVSNDALVRLIDCDSFQVRDQTKIYYCEVAVPEFLPPELQGTKLHQTIRTTNHDAFGLAVLIFHLLFMGRHPFIGYRGNEDMPIPRAIREFRFAYGHSASSMQMVPPPHSLPLACVPQDLALCFERAFSDGSQNPNARPGAKEWANQLERLEKLVQKCKADPGHSFRTGLSECPWCAIVQRGGPNFFVTVSLRAFQGGLEKAFELNAVWAQISAVQGPEQRFRPAPRTGIDQIVAQPVPEHLDSSKTLRQGVGIVAIAAGVLCVLAFCDLRIGLFTLPMFLAFSAWWAVLEIDNPGRRLRAIRRHAVRQREHEVRSLVTKAKATATTYTARFQQHFLVLSRFREQYQRIDGDQAAELRALQSSALDRQRDDFLRSQLISDNLGMIDGIGAGRLAALETYGIETAYDISENAVLQVPGFGPKLTASLTNWRHGVVARFRFDPGKGVPQADLQAMQLKYHQQRQRLSQLLLCGTHELTQITNTGVQEVERLDRECADAEVKLAQARADLRICT